MKGGMVSVWLLKDHFHWLCSAENRAHYTGKIRASPPAGWLMGRILCFLEPDLFYGLKVRITLPPLYRFDRLRFVSCKFANFTLSAIIDHWRTLLRPEDTFKCSLVCGCNLNSSSERASVSGPPVRPEGLFQRTRAGTNKVEYTLNLKLPNWIISL